MSYIKQTIPLVRGATFNFPQFLMINQTEHAYAHFDGKLCYFFVINYNTSYVACLVFNPSTLQGCVYSNIPQGYYFNNINQVGSFVRLLGNGLFLCNDGNGHTVYFQIPSLFIPDGFVHVNPIAFNALAPCGQGHVAATYYDTVSGILAVIFNNNFASDYDSWVNIYKSNGSSLTPVSGGYLGNFPTTSNSFVQSAFDFPTKYAVPGNESGTYSFQSNGLTQFSRVRNYPDPYYMGGGNSRIMYSNLQCGVANNGQSYSYFTDTFQRLASDIPNTDFCNAFGTNLPGCVAFDSDLNMAVIGNSSYGYLFTYANTGRRQQGICYVGNGAFIMIEWVTTPPNLENWIVTVLQSQVPFDDPVLPPNVSPQASSLLNWHRPISTRGLFKT